MNVSNQRAIVKQREGEAAWSENEQQSQKKPVHPLQKHELIHITPLKA
jgi:hypothetical protein